MAPAGLAARVVEELMEDHDLLPLRFGMRVRDEREAADVLASRRTELRAALDRVRGAVELSLHVRRGGANGRDDALAKAWELRLQAGTTHGPHEPLAYMARNSLIRRPGGPGEALRAAYLVERPAIGAFVGMVRRLGRAIAGTELRCVGPQPPYRFVERWAGRVSST